MEKEKKAASLENDFDFAAFEKEAVKQLKSGKPLSGKEGVLTPLIKRILENALQGELEAHLEGEPTESRNRLTFFSIAPIELPSKTFQNSTKNR